MKRFSFKKHIMQIKAVKARQIFDSRGFPTIEVDVVTTTGTFRAAVPSGVQAALHEAVDLRDGDTEFLGKGVKKALHNVNKVIGPALVQKNPDITDQKSVDDLLLSLDGTDNKANLGANALIGVSMAICRAGAAERGVPLYRHIADLTGTKGVYLPVPAFNVINGGVHAGNALALQEFLVLPTGANCFRQAMRMGTEIYHNLKIILKEKYGAEAISVGDEGGFAPNISDPAEALDLITAAIDKADYTGKVMIGVAAAASEFFKDGKYDLDFKNLSSDPAKFKSPADLLALYKTLATKYPLIYLEDPFDQDAWEDFVNITTSLKHKLEILGDSLLATNPTRIESAIEKGACNGLMIKLNQIGTVSEAMKSCQMAQEAGWGVMVSHRSGETEDPFIADFVVGVQAGHVKSGAPCRSERLAKYNQMLRIEEQLGVDAKYAGIAFKNPRQMSLIDISTAV